MSESLDEGRRRQQEPRLAYRTASRDSFGRLERREGVLGSPSAEGKEPESTQCLRGRASQPELDVACKRNLCKRPTRVGVPTRGLHTGQDSRCRRRLGRLKRLAEEVERLLGSRDCRLPAAGSEIELRQWKQRLRK